MFGLSGIPALIQGVGMFFLPHSPRWLIVNGQDEKVPMMMTMTLFFNFILRGKGITMFMN